MMREDWKRIEDSQSTAVCVFIFIYLVGFHLPKKAKYLLLGVDSSRPMVKQ